MIVELFGGPGGASLGIRTAHPDEVVVGIEWDATACATRRAAGHLTIRADVASYPTEPFVGKVSGIWASPPCPDFSPAGRRAGIEGKSGHLIFQVLRWSLALRPRWLACEQVETVLPWWKLFARQLEDEARYHTWAGVLCAADYGVPQERNRAILMAHSDRAVHPPTPTHAEHPHPDLFTGNALLPWVSMAEGLGWGMTARPSPTVTAGGTKSGGAEPLARGGREAVEREREREIVGYRRTRGGGMTERHGQRPDSSGQHPAPTITSKARSDELLVERERERGTALPRPVTPDRSVAGPGEPERG